MANRHHRSNTLSNPHSSSMVNLLPVEEFNFQLTTNRIPSTEMLLWAMVKKTPMDSHLQQPIILEQEELVQNSGEKKLKIQD
mgnify:CR=1 FL=1